VKALSLTTRIKKSKSILRLIRPVELGTDDLIYPIFVREDGKRFEIPSMKGQHYLSLEDSVKTCEKAIDLGIPGIMIFGMIKIKDADASIALQKDGFHSQIFRRLKSEFGDQLVLISNLCLCDFTEQEYCVYTEKGKVLNEKTSQMLGKIAAVHAEADPVSVGDRVAKSVGHVRRHYGIVRAVCRDIMF
jgi:porphobilinogen synthase